MHPANIIRRPSPPPFGNWVGDQSYAYTVPVKHMSYSYSLCTSYRMVIISYSCTNYTTSIIFLLHYCRLCSLIVSHADVAPPTWCCHVNWCPPPLSTRAILTTSFTPTSVVHCAGEALVLQPGYDWLQPASCPKVQDVFPAHQGICGESLSPCCGKGTS